jgi:hypothetical protein
MECAGLKRNEERRKQMATRIILTRYRVGGKSGREILNVTDGEFTGFRISSAPRAVIIDARGSETGYFVGGPSGCEIIGPKGEKTRFMIGGSTGTEIIGPYDRLPWTK